MSRTPPGVIVDLVLAAPRERCAQKRGGPAMSLILIVCAAALITTAVDIIVGARTLLLRTIVVRARDRRGRL
jgi:hypothetical protein